MRRVRWSSASGRGMPLTRTTILAQVLLALVIGGFLLGSTGVRLPVGEDRYELDVVLPDAAGLDAGDRPAVTVAGVRAGAVRDVRFDDGRGVAVARVELDGSVRGRVFADATASMTPRSALNDLVLEIDPGDPSAGRLRSGEVPAAPGAAPTGHDRVLGVFDDPTRAYAQLLIGTLREVTKGRPGALRDAVGQLPDATRETTRLVQRVARRRTTLRRMVGELDRVVTATGRRGRQLTRAIGSAHRTLEVTARRRAALRTSVEDLPATLRRVDDTFTELARFGTAARPALEALRPAARALPTGLQELRRTLPPLRGAVADTGRLVRDGGGPVRALAAGVDQLADAGRTLTPAVPAIDTIVDTVSAEKTSIRDMLQFWPGTLSATDGLGVTTRAIFFRIVDVDPRAFGLSGGTGRDTARLRSAVSRLRAGRPELFRLPRGGGDLALPVLAARALLADLCRRRHDFACALVALVDEDPPEVLRR